MNHLVAKANSGLLVADPYNALIRQFVEREFPTQCLKGENLVDIIVAEIIGTRQMRYGPRPSAEIEVAIKQVVTNKVANNEPIPFMVPWGSEKPDSSSIDIAELSAFKQMKCLNLRVQQHYAPGTEMNIRLEDASASYLFIDRKFEAAEDATRYVAQMAELLYILDLPFVKLKPERNFVMDDTFALMANKILPTMECYLKAIFSKQVERANMLLSTLQGNGWKGAVAQETFDFFMHQYSRAYPTKTYEQRVHIMARYFASAWARSQLKIRGDNPGWKGEFIDLSFIQPTPGTNKHFGRRVHYRTLPQEFTNFHIAPWRGKGYLEINNENEVTPKLAVFGDKDLRFNSHTIMLERDEHFVWVKADYVLV